MAQPTVTSAEYHFSFKVVVLGDGCVGKTTLLQQEVGGSDSAQSRVGVNFFRKFYEWRKKVYRVEYWDCPGALRYVGLTARYCAGASAALLFFDLNNAVTFQNLEHWKNSIARSSPPLKIVIGNSYSRSSREVTDKEAQQWANRNGMDYINADSAPAAHQSYKEPTMGVFQQIFTILCKSLPRVPEASLLIQKGVLLGSKLLNDYSYQRTLYMGAARRRGKEESRSPRRGKGKGKSRSPRRESPKRKGRKRGAGGGGGSGSSSKPNGGGATTDSGAVARGDETTTAGGGTGAGGDETTTRDSPTSRSSRPRSEGAAPLSSLLWAGEEEPGPSFNSATTVTRKSFLIPPKRDFTFQDECFDLEGVVALRSKACDQAMQPRRAPSEPPNSPPGQEPAPSPVYSLPWYKTMTALGIPATNPNPAPPAIGLKLNHVYGSSQKYVRQTARYNCHGNILYTAGTMGVELDPVTRQQKFFRNSHTDAILSMDIFHASGTVTLQPVFSRDRRTKQAEHSSAEFYVYEGSETLVATGEAGTAPRICVWESESMELLKTLSGFHKVAVTSLAFTRNGEHLASIGGDEMHSLAVYNWQRGELLSTMEVTAKKILCLAYFPEQPGLLLTAGHQHIVFWETMPSGHIPIKPKLDLKKGANFAVVAVAFASNKRMIAGTEAGDLWLWNRGTSLSVMVKFGEGSVRGAHPGGITCLHWGRCEVLFSGGKDGSLKVWDEGLNLLATFTGHFTSSLDPSVRSVASSGDSSKVLLGTRGNELFEVEVDEINLHEDGTRTFVFGKILHNERPIVVGHYGHEAWGLAAHPLDPCTFATCGDDCTLRVWHSRRKRQINITEDGAIPTFARAIAFSPDGRKVAIGLGGKVAGRRVYGYKKHAGKVLVFHTSTLEVDATAHDAREMISAVRYSPSGDTLAAASWDGGVYAYAHSNGRLVLLHTVNAGGGGAVLSFDFSFDGKALRTNDQAGHVRYWGLGSNGGAPIDSKEAVRKILWATQTCPLRWSSSDMWRRVGSGAEYGDVRAMDFLKSRTARNMYEGTIAMADDFGKVWLVRSPCVGETGGAAVEHRGHSLRATGVRFNADGSKLFSLGGTGREILQWDVVVENDI
jgi:microtubule-associated protein-like 6